MLNCAVLGELLPVGASVADVGSGAGLPGLVLAIARPDLRVVLVEPLLRRTVFLNEVIERLELTNVQVERRRAEERSPSAQDRPQFVTARAVAPLDRLAGWCLPMLDPGGVLLAMKGDSASAEIAEHAATLDRLGAVEVELVEVGQGIVEPATRVVRMARAGSSSAPRAGKGSTGTATGKRRR